MEEAIVNRIVDIWKKNTIVTQPEHVCKYCNKGFRRENSLAVHLCEPKRRVQQQHEKGVQLGLNAYLRFYETTQGSAKSKTYSDFVESPYYNAFVKFGRHCHSIKCISFNGFTDWLLKNNKKLDNWCSDQLYTEWLLPYIKREAVQDALERSLLSMQEYVDENKDLKNGLQDYFRYGNVNKVCYHISTGKISPWTVFNCASGLAFLEKLNEDQINLIIAYIDPDFWQRRFKDYIGDTEWIKSILEGAGL